MNDLHTADVTCELGRLLGASVVINEHVDRNEIDLNRMHQVRRDAPWLFEVVAELLGGMLADAGRAVVLVIHGWNVSQVACDVGIGARESLEGLTPVRPGSATASEAFIDGCLLPLRERVALDGVAVTIGSRYPAGHPNNFLQIFRAAGDDDGDPPCPVRALRNAGRVDAAQLELAIPLRWPGPRRDRFLADVASVVDGFVAGTATRRYASRPPVLAAGSGRVTRRRGLQFVAGDLFVMASIDASHAGPIAGRVVVSESPARLALFTGELVHAARPWEVPPLVCETVADGALRCCYDGPLVVFQTHAAFLDLERGLAEGRLVEARLDLLFRGVGPVRVSLAGERLGEVRGEIVIDGRRYDITSAGFVNDVDAVRRARAPYACITLPLSEGGPLVLCTDALESIGTVDRWRAYDLVGQRLVGETETSLRASATIDVSSRGSLLLEGTDCRARNFRLSARLERVIPVRRPGPRDTVVETRFALARMGVQVVGWVEVSVVVTGPGALTPS